jgi:transcriptional regulator with XRE-family HTH domain
MVPSQNQEKTHMDREVYVSVGAAIRARRDAIGMTQAHLAESAGLSRTSVTNIERGGQALLVHQLLELARVLRVSPASLLPNTKLTGKLDELQPMSGTIKALLDKLEEPPSRKRQR